MLCYGSLININPSVSSLLLLLSQQSQPLHLKGNWQSTEDIAAKKGRTRDHKGCVPNKVPNFQAKYYEQNVLQLFTMSRNDF